MSEYKILRASEAPDYTQGSPSPFLGYAQPLGAEQIAVNVRVLAPGAAHVPPNEDPALGHSHKTIEELYLVIQGEVRIKVGDDVHTLGVRDAILLPPDAPRAVRNETEEEAAMVMISVPVADALAESNLHRGFWPTG
ncbi:cupin domain-containing protein [Solirubrobacter sp. CPCC 204708]|uniref:Cupin domain-containing protein n=1 Tax=Solirubrobacter deserti TaxID=2282478 RepID=A0ABT4RBU0_9ACTN|nr:cupin domain-containing protein [Solirubrobacter deserti]MBE2317111.1 cupin domain-containing protein [Solirubrobacter deserti]MDA0135997.1 cupin domain-containing protein [Solirubrobacter deserti]